MADSSDNKQFEPTEQKLRKSLEEGNSLFIPQISSGATLIVGMVVLSLVGNVLYFLYSGTFAMVMEVGQTNMSKQEFDAIIITNLGLSMICIITIVFLSSVISTTVSIIQLKGFRIVPFKLKFETFNIIENAKQKFSKKNLVKLFLELLFICIIMTFEFNSMKENLNDIVNLIYLTQNAQKNVAWMIVTKLIILSSISFVIYVTILFLVEKKFYIKNLMMSYEEIKKEIEDSEGKAEVKGKIKELQQELLEDDEYVDAIIKDYGSFVISNPTHYGILIFYCNETLPIVILKGKNNVALKIISRAKHLEIPVIQSRYIARTLYELSDVGTYIPKSMIGDVGKLIGLNFELISPHIKNIDVLKSPRI